jgi:lysozyme
VEILEIVGVEFMEKVKERLRKDEGFSKTVYYDTLGVPTIGYGRNLRNRGLVKDEPEILLHNDFLDAVDGLIRNVGDWILGLDSVRLGALVNMSFQLGPRGVSRFVNMLAAIRRKDWENAYLHALNSNWAVQTPNRARRTALQIKTGLW